MTTEYTIQLDGEEWEVYRADVAEAWSRGYNATVKAEVIA